MTVTTSLGCPSSNPQVATVVIGRGRATGRMTHNRTLEPFEGGEVDNDLVRLGGPCVEKQCENFDGTCRVGAVAHATAVSLSLTHRVPACGFRTQCRWFAEHGRSVCGSCAYIRHRTIVPSA